MSARDFLCRDSLCPGIFFVQGLRKADSPIKPRLEAINDAVKIAKNYEPSLGGRRRSSATCMAWYPSLGSAEI